LEMAESKQARWPARREVWTANYPMKILRLTLIA
jgi:hypothetical protein